MMGIYNTVLALTNDQRIESVVQFASPAVFFMTCWCRSKGDQSLVDETYTTLSKINFTDIILDCGLFALIGSSDLLLLKLKDCIDTFYYIVIHTTRWSHGKLVIGSDVLSTVWQNWAAKSKRLALIGHPPPVPNRSRLARKTDNWPLSGASGHVELWKKIPLMPMLCKRLWKAILDICDYKGGMRVRETDCNSRESWW